MPHMIKFDAKRFLAGPVATSDEADVLAERMVEYFCRPMSGFTEEVIHHLPDKRHPDGWQETQQKHYTLPLPLLSEFATMYGLTEVELKAVGRMFPESVGRVIELAKDVAKTDLIRKGLDGTYQGNVMQFVAVNETRMKNKSETTQKKINMNTLLDQISAAQDPDSLDDND